MLLTRFFPVCVRFSMDGPQCLLHMYLGTLLTDLETTFDQLPQLLRLDIAGVFNLDRSTLGDDLLGSVGSASVPPS